MKTIQEKLEFVDKWSDLYHALENRVRDMIFNGTLHSLEEVQEKVYDIYDNTTLSEVYTDVCYGVDRMLKNMFRAYIIHCESEHIVPVSGYREDV